MAKITPPDWVEENPTHPILGPGPGPDYVETDQGHDYSDRVGRNAARNLLALARVLRSDTYPVPES